MNEQSKNIISLGKVEIGEPHMLIEKQISQLYDE